jgi:lysozyme
MILVTDISNYTGPNVPAKAMAAAGVRGCYVKAQQGNDGPNPFFDQQVAALRDAGIAVGAYLFCYPLPDEAPHVARDPAGQVKLFADVCKGLGSKPGDMPSMLDCEYPEPQNFTQWGCTPANVAQWIAEAAQLISDEFANTCGIYCDPSWWESLGGAGLVGFDQRPLWLADYPVGGALSAPPVMNVKIPKPWTAATIWQFTDKFSAPGVDVPVDGGVFLGDEPAWQAFLGY